MSDNKLHKVFVYGTLRGERAASHTLPRYCMYDTGPYPYIERSDSSYDSVVGVVLNVDDTELAELDRYEGLSKGLYTRETATVVPLDDDGETLDAFVYVAGPVWPKKIPSGDWNDR